jgi:hypothetical protein
MRKITLFTAAAALVLVGLGGWSALNTQARVDTPTNVRIAPLQMMTHAGNLPTVQLADYSLVFE